MKEVSSTNSRVSKTLHKSLKILNCETASPQTFRAQEEAVFGTCHAVTDVLGLKSLMASVQTVAVNSVNIRKKINITTESD